jgi:hypothetical protein
MQPARLAELALKFVGRIFFTAEKLPPGNLKLLQ